MAGRRTGNGTRAPYRLEWERDALKRLGRLPRNRRQQIRAKLQALAADPTGPQPQAKPLKGEPGTFRLRIGEWRTTYDLDHPAWPAC